MSTKARNNSASQQCNHLDFSKIYGLLLIHTKITAEIIQEIAEFCVQSCAKCKSVAKICTGYNCKRPIVAKKCGSYGKCGGYILKCHQCKLPRKTCSICDNHIFNNLCSKCIANYKSAMFIKCEIQSSKEWEWDYNLKNHFLICNGTDVTCLDCGYLYKCKICGKIPCIQCLFLCDKCKEYICYDCADTYKTLLDDKYISQRTICHYCRNPQKLQQPKYYFDTLYFNPT